MEESSGVASAPVRQTLSTCTVDVEMWPSTVVVSVVGELDMADADQVGKILIDAVDAEKPIVRLELGGLRFADSSAIKAILVGAQAAEERGVTYELVNPHDRVRRLLEVTGLANVLNLVDEAAYQEGPSSL
ncbi:MAG: STAS domain-containing protein [Ilumatobacteraceae bacterium]|nr:STAS domain-containing protein [Ilumatobacteraceae bacterium]